MNKEKIKNFLIWIFFFLVLWPITIFIIEAIFGIVYLIIGLILFIFTDVDITSEGTIVAEFIESIIFPKGMISFWSLLPWRHLWITILISIILVYFTKQNGYEKELKPFQRYKKDLEPFIAKFREHRTKIVDVKTKDEKSQQKQEDVESFFESLKKENEKDIITSNYGVFLDNANYDLFYSFINQTKESLDLLFWRVDERLLSEFLWFLRNKDINVRIITKNRTNQGYLDEFKKYCSKLNVELLHRNKIHTKLIIRDNKSISIGSSNFTEASMSKSGHFLDCNIITNHKETVQSSMDLFKSLYNNKDFTKEIIGSKLIYSRNDEDYLPFSLRPYFEKESEEIILLFSCNQVDKRIIDRIIDWNSKTPIKLYVGSNWTTSELTEDNLISMKWLYETSLNDYKNISVIPLKENIHSKLYIFKNQKIALISSQNLTVESWQSLLETGMVTRDRKDLKYLFDSINSFKKSYLNRIEIGDLEETDKPLSLFSGPKNELSIGMPWELPESNDNWRISKNKINNYFKLAKYKPTQEKKLFGSGKREEAKIFYENQILEELEEKYLSKQSITGLYSKPTRSIITGKISKGKKRKSIEIELEYLKRRYDESTSQEEKKKLLEGINWQKRELEKFD